MQCVIYISNKSQYLKNEERYGKTIDGRGVARIFKGGGVDFLLKREMQGASGASIAYVGGFRGETPEDIPFPWI